jgi:uncharacterized cupredoxin-like copper-binding protein
MKTIALLVILGALLLSACGSNNSEKVEVSLTEFGIESSTTTFEAGQRYVFEIINEGALAHEFTVSEPLRDMGMADHEMGGADHDMSMALLHIGEDELAPGSTVTIEFTFTNAADGLEFACHLTGHYEAGMFTPITVGA